MDNENFRKLINVISLKKQRHEWREFRNGIVNFLFIFIFCKRMPLGATERNLPSVLYNDDLVDER